MYSLAILLQKNNFKRKNDMDKRFVVAYKENLTGVAWAKVLIDTETGVNYLNVYSGKGGVAITPLLDSDGKPIVT